MLFSGDLQSFWVINCEAAPLESRIMKINMIRVVNINQVFASCGHLFLLFGPKLF